MESSPAVSDAALAVANVAFETARVPLRLAGRLPGMRRLAADGAMVRARARSRLQGLLEEVLTSPEVERAIDRVLAGTLPDAVVRSLLEHQVVERLAIELAAEVDVDVAVAAALEHETTQRLVAAVIGSPGLDQLLVQATDRALRGPELQRVIEHVASSPEVRLALTQQSSTLAQEMADGLRTRAGRWTTPPNGRCADGCDGPTPRELRGHRHPRPCARDRRRPRQPDRAVIGALVALISSLVGDLHPQWLVALLAAAGWLFVLAGYFTLFWSTTGQTPGMRLMQLRVVDRAGERVHVVRAYVRLVLWGSASSRCSPGSSPCSSTTAAAGCTTW